MNPAWPIEPIPNVDSVFFRVHKDWIRGDQIKPKAFQERGAGDSSSMSTNWEKYASAQDTRDQAPNPSANEVVKFNVGDLRAINLSVTHSPLPELNNRAHTDVKGLLDEKTVVQIRALMLDLFSWQNTV